MRPDHPEVGVAFVPLGQGRCAEGDQEWWTSASSWRWGAVVCLGGNRRGWVSMWPLALQSCSGATRHNQALMLAMADPMETG